MSRQKKVQLWKTFRNLLVSILVPLSVFAYDGGETWLHYSTAPDEIKAIYDGACKSLVISNAESDTLKNAKLEMDLGMKGLLGKTLTVSTEVSAGAIVLAPEGSPLVASAGFDYSTINKEGFIIKSAGGATYITGKNEVGVLRGTFAFLRQMQMGKSISNIDIKESPYFAYRVLDHWWNHYGSSPAYERLYGGDRVYTMESFGDLANGSGSERAKIIAYCRMAASLGLNGITPDGVNTTTMNSRNWECLKDGNIRNLKNFADILNTYGLKTFLSISYTSPQRVGGLSDSDPSKQAVIDWWAKKVDQIFENIPNFGGFLIKADSENEFGPSSAYGKNQSAGAKPIADALAKHGATLIWRTFVYSSDNNVDFAVTQMETFYNQTWHPNIILRMKDGPRDFQTVEPPNFIATYGGIRHGMEFEVTQEYTGQDKHVCWLVPKWKQVLDWNMKGANLREGVEGTRMRQILRGDNTWERGGGVWGISNLSSAKNWTGHYLAQANAYGYGRLAWNPLLSADQIADEWIHCSFANGNENAVQFIVNDILQKSWKTYEDYTISYSALMPAVCWNEHYSIEFDKDVAGFRTAYFMNLKNDGIGVDRKPGGNSPSSSTFPNFLPKELADSLCNITTCPEDYLLFFHHCKWDYVMKSGMSLIQSLHHNHFRGIKQVKRFINNWKLLNGKIDSDIYTQVLGKLNTQLTDASSWASTFKTEFGTKYSKAVGCDLEIVVPDANKAVTIPVGENVNLSSKFADQNGTALAETINWSVSDGGTIDATTGTNVKFSAAEDGVYEVTASLTSIPALNDKIQIFVGDWWKPLQVGVKKTASIALAKAVMKFNHTPHSVLISTPFAGNLDVISLNGTVVKSIAIPRTGTIELNTSAIGSGLYLVRLKGMQQELRNKLIIR
jgi:alpha-glucuronidase